jgi:hypothetical protein
MIGPGGWIWILVGFPPTYLQVFFLVSGVWEKVK